jgi:hypothetical protein
MTKKRMPLSQGVTNRCHPVQVGCRQPAQIDQCHPGRGGPGWHSTSRGAQVLRSQRDRQQAPGTFHRRATQYSVRIETDLRPCANLHLRKRLSADRAKSKYPQISRHWPKFDQSPSKSIGWILWSGSPSPPLQGVVRIGHPGSNLANFPRF